MTLQIYTSLPFQATIIPEGPCCPSFLHLFLYCRDVNGELDNKKEDGVCLVQKLCFTFMISCLAQTAMTSDFKEIISILQIQSSRDHEIV